MTSRHFAARNKHSAGGQLDLFGAEEQRHDCVRNGPCATCGTTRPPDHPRYMFLEPVSGECFDCNHATLEAILNAVRAGDRQAFDLHFRRHQGLLGEIRRQKRERRARHRRG